MMPHDLLLPAILCGSLLVGLHGLAWVLWRLTSPVLHDVGRQLAACAQAQRRYPPPACKGPPDA